jgi:hypothetical protein
VHVQIILTLGTIDTSTCAIRHRNHKLFFLLFTIISPGRFACQITCSIMYKLVLACHTTMKTLFILHLCCISFIHTEQVELDSKPESMSDGASTSVVLKQSSSTGSNHCFFPCLESLGIAYCHGLTEVANLPPSIKTLMIWQCSSLVSVSGEVPSLEELNISDCASLQFLPNGPHQVYSSLRVLRIRYCYGIKKLPQSLQQRLDHIEKKNLDPHLLQGNLYLIS